MGYILRIVLRIAAATVVVSAFVVASQDIQIFPGANLFGPRTLVPNADIDPILLTSRDGTEFYIWRMKAHKKKGAVLFFHGNGETVAGIYPWQVWLRELGISSYAVSYRGYGPSHGWPSEEGIYEDSDVSWEFLKSKEKGVPLGVLGSSIGTGPASYIASRYNPEFLVLLSPFISLKEIVSEHPLFWPLVSLLRHEFPNLEHLQSASYRCLIIAHGTIDTVIPVSHSRRINEDLLSKVKPVKYIEFPEVGHNDLLSKGRGRIGDELVRCLKML